MIYKVENFKISTFVYFYIIYIFKIPKVIEKLLLKLVVL